MNMRIGHGYDVHRLAEDRKLIIGGVDIPHSRGLQGHSDADVLVHAVIDSLLGGLALGDIGKLFPDNDNLYKNADSLQLLCRVIALIEQHGYTVGNLDATIVAQSPKLAPYIQRMRQNIAKSCGIAVDGVSVKATTEERLGFTGREEGIAAYAVCILTRI